MRNNVYSTSTYLLYENRFFFSLILSVSIYNVEQYYIILLSLFLLFLSYHTEIKWKAATTSKLVVLMLIVERLYYDSIFSLCFCHSFAVFQIEFYVQYMEWKYMWGLCHCFHFSFFFFESFFLHFIFLFVFIPIAFIISIAICVNSKNSFNYIKYWFFLPLLSVSTTTNRFGFSFFVCHRQA